jgi:hypothetical protein
MQMKLIVISRIQKDDDVLKGTKQVFENAMKKSLVEPTMIGRY